MNTKIDKLAVEMLGLTLEECKRFREAGFGQNIDDRVKEALNAKAIAEAKELVPRIEANAIACVQWFVDYLRELRELHGWSQTDLAARVGMKRSHLSNFELNRNEPRLSKILEFTSAFQMPLKDFVVFAPDPATGKLPSMTAKRIRELLLEFEVDSSISDLLLKAYRKESAQNRLSRVLHVGEVLKDVDVPGWLAKHVTEF